jgi:uncharacterized membrane protein YdjX (TVP38/TMEM64 family)
MEDRPALANCRVEAKHADGADAPVGRRFLLRLALLGVVLAGALALVYLSPIKVWLRDAPRVRNAIGLLGFWGYPACVVAVAVLVGCGVPRLLFCAIGGAILGFWPGLLITTLGTSLGYYAVFLFIRWGGREWALHRWPKLRKWADLIHEQGVMGVVLVRQLPIHGTLANLCLGLTHVKHRHFLIGTVVGLVPEAVPLTLVGAGLVKGTPGDSARYLAIAVVAFAIVWIVCAYAIRSMRSSRSGAKLAAEVESLKPEGEG